MKKILFTLIILIFLAGCIELEKVREQITDKDQVQQENSKGEITKTIDAKKHLLELLNKHNSLKEYSATFQTTTKQDNDNYAVQTTTLAIKGNNVRIDGEVKVIKKEENRSLVLEEQRIKTILNEKNYFECVYENEWLCSKTEISDEEAEDLKKNSKDDDYIKFVDKSEVKILSESTFEGQKTICFSVNDSEECYLEDSGVMALSRKKDVEIRLLKYSSSVEDNLFELPKDAEKIEQE